MRDVWNNLLVLIVVLACLVTSSESGTALKYPKCRSTDICKEGYHNEAEHEFFYYVTRNGKEQQVLVKYEMDQKSLEMCCNCREGDVCRLAANDPALPAMPSLTDIETLEFTGCLVPNVSYYDAIKDLNINFSRYDTVLKLSELPAEPRLEGYHLNGLRIKELIITGLTDNPTTRPKKDFLSGLPKLESLELNEGVEPEKDARLLLPKSLKHLTLYNTRLLLSGDNVNETEKHYIENDWLKSLVSLTHLKLMERDTELSQGLVKLPPLASYPYLKELVLTEVPLAPILNSVKLLNGSNLTKLYITGCGLETLPEDFFMGANVSDINLSNNTLGSLPDDVFAPLESSLVELDLSHNKLNGKTLVSAIQSLNKLKILAATNNPLGSLCGSEQYYAGERSGLPKNLKRLELRNTQATHICDDWIENDSLSEINLDRNNIQYLRYRDLRMRRSGKTPVLLSLKQQEEHDNMKNHSLRIEITKKDYEQCLKDNESQSGGTRKHTEVNLILDSFACDCKAYWLHQMLSKCPLVKPWKKDSVNCMAEHGQSELLTHDRDSLTCKYNGPCPKDCSCNTREPDNALMVRCGRMLSKTPVWPRAAGLIVLHVEPETLTTIPHLKLLELHAPNNNITKIDYLPDTLRVLDVRNNSIAQISSTAAQTMLRLSTNDGYNVSLSGNSLTCACEDESAITMLHRAKITDWNITQCADGQHVVDKKKLCHDTLLPIMLGITGALLVFTLALTILLYLRPRIKQFLFDHGMCLQYVLNINNDADDPMKTHDVFISYSHKDSVSAKKLIEMLERHSYSTIEHCRDWLPGESVMQQIVNSVMSARRTLLLVSDNYVESKWALEEFHAAHAHAMERGSARVIVVLCQLESVQILPKDLQLYLKNNTYLDWSDRYFWDKMWRVMPQLREVPPPAIALLQDTTKALRPDRRQPRVADPALLRSRLSVDKELPLSELVLVAPVRQSQDSPWKSSVEPLPVTPVVKKLALINGNKFTLPYNIQRDSAVPSVRGQQIIADPALLLSRLSLDKDPLSELVLVAPVQHSPYSVSQSSRQASPITPVVTEPSKLDENKYILPYNIQSESPSPVMHASVSPCAC